MPTTRAREAVFEAIGACFTDSCRGVQTEAESLRVLFETLAAHFTGPDVLDLTDPAINVGDEEIDDAPSAFITRGDKLHHVGELERLEELFPSRGDFSRLLRELDFRKWIDRDPNQDRKLDSNEWAIRQRYWVHGSTLRPRSVWLRLPNGVDSLKNGDGVF